ncbi:uncharacterized protein PG986_007410 [Apiospora aurea]|uniref:Uncharacterized protein n=1 Tax=Apiospora aurea TaxID=335848 RepID=A0ABR1QCH8_9PEZI
MVPTWGPPSSVLRRHAMHHVGKRLGSSSGTHRNYYFSSLHSIAIAFQIASSFHVPSGADERKCPVGMEKQRLQPSTVSAKASKLAEDQPEVQPLRETPLALAGDAAAVSLQQLERWSLGRLGEPGDLTRSGLPA